MPGSCSSLSILAWREAGHLRGVEAGERPAVALALAQDRRPGEPGLRALEREQLVQRAVVALRHAPLLVVVGGVELVSLRHPAQRFIRGSLRRAAKARRSASRMTSTSGSTPVQSSKPIRPCSTSISSPSRVSQPAAAASAEEARLRRVRDHVGDERPAGDLGEVERHVRVHVGIEADRGRVDDEVGVGRDSVAAAERLDAHSRRRAPPRSAPSSRPRSALRLTTVMLAAPASASSTADRTRGTAGARAARRALRRGSRRRRSDAEEACAVRVLADELVAAADDAVDGADERRGVGESVEVLDHRDLVRDRAVEAAEAHRPRAAHRVSRERRARPRSSGSASRARRRRRPPRPSPASGSRRRAARRARRAPAETRPSVRSSNRLLLGNGGAVDARDASAPARRRPAAASQRRLRGARAGGEPPPRPSRGPTGGPWSAEAT